MKTLKKCEFKEDPNPELHNSSMFHVRIFVWTSYYNLPLHYSSTKSQLKLRIF